MEISWVFNPSGLPLLGDVSGRIPFDILDRRWDPAVYMFPGSGGFCQGIGLLVARDTNMSENPDECDFSSTFLDV